MATNFGNSEGVLFNQLGITSIASGITVQTTLYNSVTGQTTSTAFVPGPLNYILGSENAGQAFVSSTFVGISFGVLSLTTQASRIVQISLTGSGTNAGYVEARNQDETAPSGFQLRCLRGPSTILNDYLVSFPGGSIPGTACIGRIPASAIVFTDFSPLSGAATYILEGKSVGASGQITLNGVKMLVRQL